MECTMIVAPMSQKQWANLESKIEPLLRTPSEKPGFQFGEVRGAWIFDSQKAAGSIFEFEKKLHAEGISFISLPIGERPIRACLSEEEAKRFVALGVAVLNIGKPPVTLGADSYPLKNSSSK